VGTRRKNASDAKKEKRPLLDLPLLPHASPLQQDALLDFMLLQQHQLKERKMQLEKRVSCVLSVNTLRQQSPYHAPIVRLEKARC